MELSSTSSHGVGKSVWVSEDAFSFLEPAVRECCADYKQYSHWGITEIRRVEWPQLQRRWQGLADKLERASSADEYGENVWLGSDESKQDFREHFSSVKAGAVGMISELSSWIDGILAEQPSVFLKGI
jgi:hypothetical protein